MRNSKARVAEDEYQILAGSSLVSGVIAPKLSTAAPSSGGGILFVILGMGGIFQNLELLALVAGAWTERKKMYHGGSFLKLADDNMDSQNLEAQNR